MLGGIEAQGPACGGRFSHLVVGIDGVPYAGLGRYHPRQLAAGELDLGPDLEVKALREGGLRQHHAGGRSEGGRGWEEGARDRTAAGWGGACGACLLVLRLCPFGPWLTPWMFMFSRSSIFGDETERMWVHAHMYSSRFAPYPSSGSMVPVLVSFSLIPTVSRSNPLIVCRGQRETVRAPSARCPQYDNGSHLPEANCEGEGLAALP